MTPLIVFTVIKLAVLALLIVFVVAFGIKAVRDFITRKKDE